MTNKHYLLHPPRSSVRVVEINEEKMTDEKAQSILALAKRDDYIKRHFKRLIGKGITQNQAAEKYGVVQANIRNWKRRGYIKSIGTPDDDPTAVLVDEADVAYCVEAYKTMGTKPGQKLFNKDGSLYIPKDLGELLFKQLLQPA